MLHNINYTVEKFTIALRQLATSEGNVRERLTGLNELGSPFKTLRDDDFEGDAQVVWKSIRTDLEDVASLDADQMRDLANRIVDLYHTLRWLRDDALNDG